MIYKATLSQEEFNQLAHLLNEAVRANGLLGELDIKARTILSKFTQESEKAMENILPQKNT